MDRTLTNNMVIQRLGTKEQILPCYSIMKQLRPHLTDEDAFVEQVLRQITAGYHLASCQEENEIKALVGFRFLEFLAWGKVLYIDDLITDSSMRKKGYGARLLQWTIEEAKNAGCDEVHLDSGPQRHEAHRLYLNQGFQIIGYHFKHSIN